MDDVVEKVARAICAEYGDDFDEQPKDCDALRQRNVLNHNGIGIIRSHDPGLPTQEDWLNISRAAITAHLAALLDIRMVVVPKEPTRQMEAAGECALVAHPNKFWGGARLSWVAMIVAMK